MQHMNLLYLFKIVRYVFASCDCYVSMIACWRVSKGLEVLCEVPVVMNLSLSLSRNNMCVYLFTSCLGPCTKLAISG